MAVHPLDHLTELLAKEKDNPQNRLPYENVAYDISNNAKGLSYTVTFEKLSPADQAKHDAMVQAQGKMPPPNANAKPQEVPAPKAEVEEPEEPESKAASSVGKLKLTTAGKRAVEALKGVYPEQFLKDMGIGG